MKTIGQLMLECRFPKDTPSWYHIHILFLNKYHQKMMNKGIGLLMQFDKDVAKDFYLTTIVGSANFTPLMWLKLIDPVLHECYKEEKELVLKYFDASFLL